MHHVNGSETLGPINCSVPLVIEDVLVVVPVVVLIGSGHRDVGVGVNDA